MRNFFDALRELSDTFFDRIMLRRDVADAKIAWRRKLAAERREREQQQR